ncbi:hyalin-like [Amphiura filiformis]|uniref:hyalin-like n=1 Tax=Amphiura filiformis TaxID=82378 RepID=UPI003B20C8E2
MCDLLSNYMYIIFTTADTVSPTITNCPSDIIANVEEGSMSASVSWTEPSAIDASGNVTLIVKTHESGERFGIGANTVMYIFADPANNLAFCTFAIKITSNESRAPTILFCPSNRTLEVDERSLGTIVSWDEPVVEDTGNVMLLIQTHVSGTFFTIGTTIVSYIFRDNANNMEKCSFSVTVTGDYPDIGAVNPLRQSEGSGGNGGTDVSYIALVLSMIAIVCIFIVVVLLYFRRKDKKKNIDLDVLAMSATNSM